MGNGLTRFVILSAAVWRLASLLVDEEGPALLFVRLRHLVGVRYDADSAPYGLNEWAKLFTCIWCISVALGALASLADRLVRRSVLRVLWQVPVYALAISAGAILWEKICGPR